VSRRSPGDQPEFESQRAAESDRCHSRHVVSDASLAEHDYIEEVTCLRSLVSDLEGQLNDLASDNKRLQRFQAEGDSQRQLNDDIQRQLEDAQGQLRDEQLRSKFLSEQVKQLEHLLDGKRHLTEVKEQMLERMHNEYGQIMADYQRLLDLNGVQTGQLRQAKVQISDLEAQVEELRSSARLREREVANGTDFVMNDFGLLNTKADKEETIEVDPVDIPQDPPVHQRIEPPPVQQQRVEPLPAKRAALVDNIHFGQEPANEAPDNLESMSVPEMKDLLEILRAQKEEVERQLNKAPQKGRLMAHVRREKEEMEEQLDELNKRIAKIRFTLRRLHEL
jgi:chromosome segregation ATPase